MKISQYPSASESKLTDKFVVAQDNSGTVSTKSVTTEQIGDAVFANADASDLSYDGTSTTTKSVIDNLGVASSISPTTTKGTFSACYQSVIGDIVVVQGVFTCSENISAGGAVAFTLPYGLKTNTNASNFLMYDNTAGVNVHVRLANNGDVTPIDSMTTHSYRFTFTYLK